MYRKYIKRVVDILLSVCAMPIFALSFMILAPIIKLTDKGHIFHKGKRLGYNGKPFDMFKYRSMKMNAPDIRNEDNTTYNSEEDERVTPIGRILRKTSLDELPQIINVLIGDMSFIGPRPNLYDRPWELLSDIEKERITVKPGITGYNQAYFRNSNLKEDRFQQDIYYVRHVSFGLDIKILFATVRSILTRKNIYADKEPATFEYAQSPLQKKAKEV